MVKKMVLQSLILINLLASQVVQALSDSAARPEDPGIVFDTCCFSLTLRSSPARCKWESCTCLKLNKGLLIDCSMRNMTSIPSSIPIETVVLLLNHNHIQEISNVTFFNNSNLVYLDLSFNNITFVMSNSLTRLSQLQTLLLHHNNLRYTEDSLNSVDFHHLVNLSCLRIEQNGNISETEDYPAASLMSLKKMQTLYMDGLSNRMISKEFSYLKNLRTVVLTGVTGRCELRSVTRENFVYLSHIEKLALLNCSLVYIEKGSFEELTNLRSLNLSFNTELKFHSMSNITYGLTKLSRFRSLNLTKIHSTFGKCTYLDSSMLRYFNQTTMQELILDANRLSTISCKALNFVPPNITYLSIGDNKMDIDRYLLDLLCNFNSILPNLRTIIISKQDNKRHIGELISRSARSLQKPFSERLVASDKSKLFVDTNTKSMLHLKCYYDILEKCPNCKAHLKQGPCPWPGLGKICIFPFPLLLPPNLETIDFSRSFYRISIQQICFCGNNSLTNLNLKSNLIYSFPGPFYGLKRLETLDFGENYCHNITEASFQNMPNLRKLNLSSNYLGSSFEGTKSMLPFKNLQKLTHLDLSNNKLRSLPRDIFSDLKSIEYLSLSENRLSTVDYNIDKLTKLTVLDLSHNLLETISEDVRAVLDFVLIHNNATVDMTQNKLTCTCKYEGFIKWVIKNRRMFINFNDYCCSFDNGDHQYLKDATVTSRLQKECTNYIPLIVGASIGVGLVIAIVTSVILWRYRWHIRYMYFSAKLQYHGYKRVDDDDHYSYDIFVSYADDDSTFVKEQMVPELEGNRQLRLLVHERDFPFGRLVTENIHQAIASSRRTLLVVSPSYLKSNWCKYEMNIAKIESINRDKEVLCVVKKDSVATSGLPLELMDIINKNTYLEFPSDPELYKGFWDSIEALFH